MKDPPNEQFFISILPGFRGGVKIPDSFLKNLGGEKYHQAVLRRGKKEWRVKINEQFFREGWSKFAMDNKLDSGDYVAFEHEGDMVFRVMIFDGNGDLFEKEDSSSMEQDDDDDDDDDDEDDDDDDDNHDDEDEDDDDDENEEDDDNDDEESIGADVMDAKQNPSKKIKLGGREEKVFSCRERSEHPHFISIVKPYMTNWSVLNLPSEFAKSNGLKGRKRDIIVKSGGNERSWSLKLKTVSKNVVSIRRGSTLAEVLKANGLKEGDHYKFELIKNGSTPVARILPHKLTVDPPETEGRKSESSPISHREGKRMLNEAKSKPDCCPYFNSTIPPYCVRGFLNLPLKFCKSNELIAKTEMILIDERKRQWPVRLRKSANRFSIEAGWRKFHKANGLKEGDAYKFEVIKNGKSKTKPVARFSIVCKRTGKSTIVQKGNSATSGLKSSKVCSMEEDPPEFCSVSSSQSIHEADDLGMTESPLKLDINSSKISFSFEDLMNRIEAARSTSTFLPSGVKSIPQDTMRPDEALHVVKELLSWVPTDIYGLNSNKVANMVATLLNNSLSDDVKGTLTAFQQQFAQNCGAYSVYKPKIYSYLALAEKIALVDKKVEGLGEGLRKMNEDLNHVIVRKAELEGELKELNTRQKELEERSLCTAKVVEEALSELVSLRSSEALEKKEFELSLPVVCMADTACESLKEALQKLLSCSPSCPRDGSGVH